MELARSNAELPFLSAGRAVVADITDHRYADAPQDLYVHLADRDVYQSGEVNRKSIGKSI